jgi:hypothetical protein
MGLRRLKQRSDIGAAVTAYLAGEFRLKIGNPHVIARAAGIDHNGVRAFVVAAIDEKSGRPDSRISPRVIFCCLGIGAILPDIATGLNSASP